VQALDTSLVSIGYLTDAQVDQLTVQQVEAVPSGWLDHLTPDQAVHVTADQIASITNPYDFYNMPSAVRAALDIEAVQALDTSLVSIGYLTDAQRAELTTAQVQDLAPGHFHYLPADRIPELSADQITSIPNASTFNGLSVDQRDALTHEQIQALSQSLSGIVFTGTAAGEALDGNSNVNLLQGGEGDDTLDAGAWNDVLEGGEGDDSLVAGEGDDLLAGGAGTDTAVFSGLRSEYEFTANDDGTITVTDLVDGRDGTDTLDGIESLQFQDQTVSTSDGAADGQLIATDVAGLEGQPITLQLDYDAGLFGSVENVSLSGLPDGSALTAGTAQPDGSWEVPVDGLAGLTLTLPDDWSGDLEVQVAAVVSKPVRVATVEGGRGDWTPISLGDSSYDWDAAGGEANERSDSGSGFLSNSLGLDAPDHYSLAAMVEANSGSTLNNGVGFVFGYEDGDNYYQVSWDDYSTNYSSDSDHKDFSLIRVTNGVEVVLDSIDQADLPSDFHLELRATQAGLQVLVDGEALLATDGAPPALGTFGLYTHDNDGGVSYDNVVVQDLDAGSPAATFHVEVTGVADAATVTTQEVLGAEDSWIAVPIAITLGDTDGSEAISSVRLTGVPEGSSVSPGTDLGEGIWSISPDQLDSLQVQPPENYSGELSFEVEVTTSEDDGDSTTTVEAITLMVGGTADGLTLVVTPASGLEDEPIALNIDGQVGDDSEQLSYTIAGVPDGASLTAGSDNLDGTWTLTASEVAGLYLTPPEGSSEDIELVVTATVVEPAGPLPLTVSLGGEDYGGAPHYVIYVDGEPVASGDVTWSVPSGQDPIFQDVTVTAPFEGDGPHSVWVEFTNDAWGGTDDTDRNLYVDNITLGDMVFEAEGESVEYDRHSSDIDGQEGMYWTGKLDFDVSSAFESSESASLHVAIEAVNDAPTAEAGVHFNVDEGSVVGLNGSGTDADGDELTYAWVQVAGTPVVLDDPYAASPTFTAPEGLVNSDLAFELQVSDGEHTVTDQVTVTVVGDDDAPSADAGEDRVAEEGQIVSLAGFGTDPEGQGLTYQWVQLGGPTVPLSDPSSATPVFAAPEGLSNTDIVFELRVSDGTSTSTDTVTVTVEADNDAPSANAGVNQAAAENDVVTLVGAGTDPEGQGLTYTWTQVSGPTVTLDDASAAAPSFTAPEGTEEATIVFELQVSDGTNTSSDTVSVFVAADDDAATVSAGGDQVVAENAMVNLVGVASDAEGQDLTYTWIQTSGTPVVLDDPNASSPNFTAPEGLVNSQLVFELQVSDGTNVTSDSVAITIVADNDAPSASAGSDLSVSELAPVTLSGSGTDPEGEGLTYTWVQVSGTPVVLSDTSAASPTFNAPEGLANSDLVFELRVTDGTSTSTDTVTVSVAANDDAPSAEAGPNQAVAELDLVSLSGSGTDPEGVGLSYNWVQVSGPTVVLDDPSAASPSFTAPEGLANTELVFELQVTDGANTSTDTISVSVAADNDAPSASAGSDQAVDELSTVVLSGSGTDPEGEGLTYTWTQVSGTPVVLDDPSAASPTFDAPEGLVNSDLVFQLQVSDGTNTSADTVTVSVAADNDAPSANAGPNLAATEGDVVTLAGSGSDPEGQGLTYTWAQVSGPVVTLDDASAASPSFTAPEGLEDATVVFELQVSDGTNTSSDTISVLLEADNDGPEVSAGGDQLVDEGDVVTLTSTSSDAEGQDITLTWVQVSGTPVVLDDPHAASPTFTAPEGLVNSELVFALQASDGTNEVSDTVTITVAADNDAPSANAGPNVSVAELASVTLSGAGTDPEGQGLTYSWVQVSGTPVVLDDPSAASPTFSAPEGLANSNLVFELEVSDGVNTSADTVTVTVAADNDAPSTSAGGDQAVAEGDIVSLAGSATDPEGQGLSYTWVQVSGPQVLLTDPTSGSPSFVAPEGLANTELVFELRATDGVNTSTDTVAIQVAADNDAPSADAGPPMEVEEGSVVHLAGGGTDPEGQGLTYEWVQISGPEVTLDDPNAASASFVAPEGVSNTDVVFELHVSDGTTTSSDTITVTVEADNDAPFAEAGPNLFGIPGSPVTLLGSGSDAESAEVTYTWVQTAGVPVTLDDPNSASPSFVVPPGSDYSTISFQLQVSDGERTSVDNVNVSVAASPVSPDDFDAPLPSAPLESAGSDSGYHSERMEYLADALPDGVEPEDLNLTPRWDAPNTHQTILASPKEMIALGLELEAGSDFESSFAPMEGEAEVATKASSGDSIDASTEPTAPAAEVPEAPFGERGPMEAEPGPTEAVEPSDVAQTDPEPAPVEGEPEVTPEEAAAAEEDSSKASKASMGLAGILGLRDAFKRWRK
ncbi:MAG: Ig-like domain-containing protein, partial [Planctomycetota bacterium]|nr:Ig-like domain-containing protein [Planctomycetota bacterium]